MEVGRSYKEESEDEDKEDNYLLNRNILLRNYQERLVEVAKNGNTIIYLPTGAGKTLIAINVLCSRGSEIRRRFSEGGKRAFFTTTTKVLAHQIWKVLQISTKFKIACFTGDMNVDTWNREKWLSAFEENQVLVLTGEILKQLLELNMISSDRISLVVFDECHHAVAEHPYKLALEALTADDPPDAPLLLGLTAVLLNSDPKSDRVLPHIKSLECAFKGKVATEVELQNILSLSANPTDKIIEYEENRVTPLTENVIHFCEAIIDVFNNLVLHAAQTVDIPEGGVAFKEKNRAKRIKRCFVQCKEHFEELGVSCGLLSTLFYIIFFEQLRLISQDEAEMQCLIYAKTQLNKIRKDIYKVIGEEETFDWLFRHSSPKVQKLIHVLKENMENSNGKLLSTIVFVRQRATAVVLAYFFKLLSATDENFSSVKADFVVGSSVLHKETFIVQSKSEHVLKEFASGALNLLFSTNVLEEGIDVSACNIVISFDFPLSYSSYFQSRGRARDKRSIYYMFLKKSDTCDKGSKLNGYRKLEKVIHKSVCEDDEATECEEEQEDEERVEQKIRIRGKSGEIEVNGITAIKAVYRYCSSLPQDKHALLSPAAWYEDCSGMKKGFVRLPMNCPVREIVEGEPCESKKQAKRSAFLAVLKRLHEIGELDDDLNIRSFALREENFDDLFPHYRKENIDKSLPQPGTRKRKQIYKLKFGESLSGCLPVPGVKAYLHVIDLTVAFGKPELQRKAAIYEILRSPVTFALISRKKLFKIFQFPLFLDLGQIDCDLLVNYDEITLTESEFHDIKACHFALFKGVTRILKSCQVFDNENKEYSFLLAPVEKNEEGRFVLNWDLIRCDFCKDSRSALVRYNPTKDRNLKRKWHRMSQTEIEPTSCTSLVPFNIKGQRLWAIDPDEKRKEPQFAMTEADYKYFIVVPNYRKQDPPQCYIVNKFCHDLSPLSPFSENYVDYVSYYKQKYEIDITNMKQPLLRVSALYNCSNYNTPRTRKARRAREKYTEYEELLIPELCDVIPFDRRFWLKALLLPTILNRICHVYSVEEFRRRIVGETGLGKEVFPVWEPLRVDSVEANQEEEDGMLAFKKLEVLKSSLPVSKLKDKAQANRKMILDPLYERNLYEIGLCDLEFYVRSLEELPLETSPKINEELLVDLSAPVPVLGLLSPGRDKSGPHLAQVVQACTSKSANDIVNYERLEVLGDSFLKFSVSLFLFRNYSVNEGLLTNLKGKLVGNRNLLYCGLAKNLPDVINVNDFVPLSEWNPPLLRVPERFVEAIVTKQVDPAVLYRLDISTEEQFSGILSEDTVRMNEEIIDKYEKYYEVPSSSLLPYKTIADKTVSDCLEAFIGLYLLTLGLPGGFEFLSWVGVLPAGKGSHSELVEKPYDARVLVPDSDNLVMSLLNEVFYSELEDTLNYRFRNKILLLEALTHPSYYRNRVTDCYQRLEFLGDAVLDFLITLYVYQHFGDLSPGQVTDIRSSLVNNVTFACLVVRYEIHKHMLSFSSTLNKSIENFVSFQVSRNHVIDENVAILLEESDCLISESIQVPKALGDVFESLAGAIYLDSGNSLETVWTVYYRLMKREIDEFTKSVPKGSVRMLQEICGDKPYYETKVVGNKTKVMCCVYYENREIKAHGFGRNKQEGKKSACKIALNKILELKK